MYVADPDRVFPAQPIRVAERGVLWRAAFVSVGLFALTPPLPANAGDVEVVVQAASDWMYHGTTETDGNPAIGFVVDWQVSSRSFVGLEVHQAEVDGAPQRHRSVAVYAGTGVALSDSWYVGATVVHREFPKAVKEWDFTEFQLRLEHNSGLGLTVDYSPDYYEHNTRSFAGELSYERELTERLYAYASVGVLELEDSRFTDYRFAQVGAGWRMGQVVIDVAYRANSEGDDADFGREELSEPRIVAQLSWRVR